MSLKNARGIEKTKVWPQFGAFSMISQSLGLEVGGALGGSLFVAQALGVVMYVFGFRAGWEWAAQSMGLPALPSPQRIAKPVKLLF